MSVLPAWAGPKDDLANLRSRIHALQQELERAEKSKGEAADALRESERAISDANRRLKELKARSEEVDLALAQLKAQRNDMQGAIQAQRQALGELLYQRYVNGQQQETLRLLLNHRDPNQVARELYYYSYLSRAQAELIGKLRANLAALEAVTHSTQEKSAELAAIAAEQEAERQRLEQEKRSRAAVLARIAKKIETQRQEIGKLKRDEQRLTRLVERLSKMFASKKPSGLLHNNLLPDASFDGRPFSRLKGLLHLPVQGELMNRFGSPRAEGGLTWKGLFIRSPAGEAVKAIAAGRVVFADWLRGFGNLLILDHGQGYMSLYAYNEALLKRVGDRVKGGDTVATVGNTGGNHDSGLYFEIRHQGKPVDPLKWVSVR